MKYDKKVRKKLDQCYELRLLWGQKMLKKLGMHALGLLQKNASLFCFTVILFLL